MARLIATVFPLITGVLTIVSGAACLWSTWTLHNHGRTGLGWRWVTSGAVLTLGAFLVAAVWARPTDPVLWFAVLWLLLTILPASIGIDYLRQAREWVRTARSILGAADE